MFDTRGGDSRLNFRSGQVVEVVRELGPDDVDTADVGRMFRIRFEDGHEDDAFEDELTDAMGLVKAARLPGFYTDERGAYGIVLGTVYICCFINSDDYQYDVTADTVDENGVFGHNLDWTSYITPDDAVARLRFLVKHYARGMNRA